MFAGWEIGLVKLADAASAAGLDHSEINATMTDAVVAALADRGW